MTRRALCHIVGRRMIGLSPEQAASAWAALAVSLEEMLEDDIPKFKELIAAIRKATIQAHGKAKG